MVQIDSAKEELGECPSFSTVGVFLKMEKEGLCDGFLWPYEGGRISQLEWLDGEKAVPYETSRGTLWMRQGVHKYYGFTDGHQFAKAAKAGRLLANKPRGIITVGGLRIRKEGGRVVYLVTPDCPVKFQFIANSPEDEALVSEILSRNFEGCRVFSSNGFLGGVDFPTRDFWRTFRLAMGSKHRRDLLFLMFLGLVSAAFAVFGIFEEGWILGGALSTFLFILMVARFCGGVPVEASRTTETQ